MSGSGWDTLPDTREWSGGPHGCPEVVERPSRMPESVRVWSVGPPGFLGEVGRPSRTSGFGLEALPKVREWSVGPPGYPGLVGSPSRMSGSVR